MDPAGHLNYGVWTGSANVITSPNTYNDGKWHQVVATQSSTTGMSLYVDGILVGTNGQTQAQAYSGYWKFGGDSTWAGSNYFNGQLDEAAIYDGVLSASQVKAHYNASPAAVNASPVASFTQTCTDGACTFDSTGSSDPDGSIATYAWDFGDGKASTDAKPAHSYSATGSYQVSLTVTDNKGATNTVTQTVAVTVPAQNVNPVAALTQSCTEWSCTFDGSGSSDSDGSIASYAWDFGDGATSTDAKPSHEYTANGTYTVKLTVTDNRGGTDSATKQVTVHKNAAPKAAFVSDCTNLACTFDGSSSSDSDGSVASYAWDFGDGKTSTEAKPSHTFGADGAYDVKLTVTDNDGATGSVTKTVNVTAHVNAKPTADFSQTCTNLDCSFNASASTDSDGSIASYSWDFGDNGQAGSGKTPTHSYSAAGTYSVKLTVTDNEAASDTKTSSVVVTAAPAGPISADNFGRTTTKWGSADTGGAWTYSGSTFSTNGSTGDIKLAAAGVSATAFLNSVSAQDVNVVTDFSVDKMATGSGTYNTLVVRKVGNSDYRATFQELTGGKVKLTITKTVGGTATNLKQVALSDLTYSSGDKIRVRFVVSGNGSTDLSLKAWKVGTSEPASAQVTASDSTTSLQAPGSFAIVSYLASNVTDAPVTVSVDNLLITAP